MEMLTELLYVMKKENIVDGDKIIAMLAKDGRKKY